MGWKIHLCLPQINMTWLGQEKEEQKKIVCPLQLTPPQKKLTNRRTPARTH